MFDDLVESIELNLIRFVEMARFFFFFGTLGRFFQLFPFQYLIENLSFELDIAEFIHPGKGFSLELNVQKIN